MSARQPGPYDSIARKWLALAERRRAHVIELRDSGRWRHYYSSAELLDAIQEAVQCRDAWARIAGVSPQDSEPVELDDTDALVASIGEAVRATAARRKRAV